MDAEATPQVRSNRKGALMTKTVSTLKRSSSNSYHKFQDHKLHAGPCACPVHGQNDGARDGNHALAGATCPYVATRAALPAAFHMPIATAVAATAHAGYIWRHASTHGAALCG